MNKTETLNNSPLGDGGKMLAYNNMMTINTAEKYKDDE